ncbi:hypothetical protein SOV_33810 [Sporomusa ovata DSM 2662]|uniref:Uncharacterized protein n=1 Tax=Sporomusa ovata TaxID=2378 RepID=A0A0U1L2I2_9FIRM|nr:hypothetical protein SOV_5c04840 [Sporomusa ovata DSM 2662]CQR73882.1 hypothetical protein SpAn4DRAFT_0344 [Sporomusa ovata]
MGFCYNNQTFYITGKQIEKLGPFKGRHIDTARTLNLKIREGGIK